MVSQKQVDNYYMKITSIRKFFISLNQNISKKTNMFTINHSPELERILYLLFRDRLIAGYHKEKSDKNKYIYTIFLIYDSIGISIIKKIKILDNEAIYMRQNNLKIFKHKLGYKWMLIRTSKGLFTISDCLKFKLGGQILVYFN